MYLTTTYYEREKIMQKLRLNRDIEADDQIILHKGDLIDGNINDDGVEVIDIIYTSNNELNLDFSDYVECCAILGDLIFEEDVEVVE